MCSSSGSTGDQRANVAGEAGVAFNKAAGTSSGRMTKTALWGQVIYSRLVDTGTLFFATSWVIFAVDS